MRSKYGLLGRGGRLKSCVLFILLLNTTIKKESPKACVNHQPIAFGDSHHEKTQLFRLHCFRLVNSFVSEENHSLHFIYYNTLVGVYVPS